VEATPISGTLAKTPDAANVCEGTDVSATLTAGNGGNGTDELEFRSHDGTNWTSWANYTSGNDISTSGLTEVEIRTRRMADYCSDAGYNTVSWQVDTESPSATAQNNTVYLDPSGNYTLTVDDVLSDYSDNVTANEDIEITINPSSFTCADLGQTIQVEITLTDECGNPTTVYSDIIILEGTNFPSPWESCNTHISANGSSTYSPCTNDGTFYLTATGQSSSTNDVFHYVYQEMSGNQLTVIARLDNVQNGGWAGVMMRESCDPASKTFFFKTQLYSAFARVGFRQIDNRAVRMVNVLASNVRWMKIHRNGYQFRFYTSYNGVSWQLRYRVNIAMSNTIQVGIFTESMRYNRTSLAWFDNVEVAGYLKAGEAFTETEIMENNDSDRIIDLYPNPSSDQMTISIEGNEAEVNYSIMDMEGRMIQQSNFSGSEHKLDVSGFKPGLYVIRFELDGELFMRRIVVM
jgi:hypothetical protein